METSTRFKTKKKEKMDRPRTGAGPDDARYLNSSPMGVSLVIRTTQGMPSRAHMYKRLGKYSEEFDR